MPSDRSSHAPARLHDAWPRFSSALWRLRVALSLACLPALGLAADDDGPTGNSFTLIWSIVETLPNDSRRYLIIGALLATILLLVRHQPTRRAPKGRSGTAVAGRNIAVAKSYPSDVTMIPGTRTGSKTAFGILEQGERGRAAAEGRSLGSPARPEPPRQDPTVTGEMDFSTLHKKAIDAPRPSARRPADAKPPEDLPDLLDLDEDPPASGGSEEPEFLLDDDDPMFALDGDEGPDDAEAFDDDDPLFMLDGDAGADADGDDVDASEGFDEDDPLFALEGDADGDEAPGEAEGLVDEPAPETDVAAADELAAHSGDDAPDDGGVQDDLPPQDDDLAVEPAPVPEMPAVPAEEPAPAVARSAPRLKARVVIPRRAHEQVPTLAFIDCDGLTGPTAPSESDDSGPRSIVDVVCRLLASKAPPADVLAFRIGAEEVAAEGTVTELAARLRADGHDPQRFRVLVDLDVAEADVSRMRAFSRALAAEGFGFGLTAVEPRNRLPMVVKMTEAVLLRFDAASIDAALDTDAGVDQLARIAGTVRERQAHVALRTALPDGRQRLLEARGQGLRWEYLEAPKAAG